MPGRSRIEILHAIELNIFFNEQDMRMSANKHVRLMLLQQKFDTRVVSTRSTGDMSHQYGDTLNFETQIFWVKLADVLSINISVDL